MNIQTTFEKINALNEMEAMLDKNVMLPLSVIGDDGRTGFISIENAQKALNCQGYEYETVDGRSLYAQNISITLDF
ncbi:hypothetical protein N799_13480 [Lysobacter arseniciresistens ZS79]|uniref:Uncharacterized protein n=1 Tax=Lysobacter arseniciresistens ZS79 TaxID=913325 RepID=A0A0A0ERX4_9GAMM|nr:hypothetical protein [Lysobacter arseniciresistens]KGM51892.1 hypothetical protein N799_13480 [Lysobacter arseniciresistens ZS79]